MLSKHIFILCSNLWLHNPTLCNKKMHSKYGNRYGRLGLAVASWNCRRGLLCKRNFPTEKVDNIATFLRKYNIDVLAISEAGLHGVKSRTIKKFPVTETMIRNALRIEGYEIILPESWYKHNTARIFLYIKSNITFQKLSPTMNTQDLPLISIKAKRGKEPFTILSAFYREWTGGISGLESTDAQTDRLTRAIAHWQVLNQ